MNRKKIVILVSILAFLLIAGIVASQFVSVGMANLSEAHGTISIAFDKQQMRSVDRMVLIDGDRTVELTNRALLDAVVDETMAATHLGGHSTTGRRIELYAGDTLVRSMIWTTCCDVVEVYGADESHWFLTVEGAKCGGSVYLSTELVQQLNALLEEVA